MIRGMCIASCLILATGCSNVATQSEDVTLDTSDELAWAQHQENLRFARDYLPRCVTDRDRPRALVMGFGRFHSHTTNASGRMVSELLDELVYPVTDPPAADEIDPPAPQTAVALGSIELGSVGEVDVCAMVLPVFWDLAAVLVLAEIEAFDPDFVLMNGVRGSEQPLYFELGSINAAHALDDGSTNLQPIETGTPLVPTAPADEHARPELLSWRTVRARAADAITNVSFEDVVEGAVLAGYPRSSNTYLCNDVTYVVGYLMDHAGETVRLMQASEPRAGAEDGIDVRMHDDRSSVPRVFVHWPGAMREEHIAPGAEVMRSIVEAQLEALVLGGETPIRGDNAFADIPPG